MAKPYDLLDIARVWRIYQGRSLLTPANFAAPRTQKCFGKRKWMHHVKTLEPN
jgi:hypothetical protein